MITSSKVNLGINPFYFISDLFMVWEKTRKQPTEKRMLTKGNNGKKINEISINIIWNN